MELDKASSVNVGITGLTFRGEYGEILGNTPIDNLKSMVAGYTNHGTCGNSCPFCKFKPDISIPGFYIQEGGKHYFKLIIDRRRRIIKKLVNTVVNLKANPTHILYITAVNVDQAPEFKDLDNYYLESRKYSHYCIKDNTVYIFQVLPYK